ncbi:hypothetical protein ACLOJK_012951 [Asimina triloba]
MAASLGSSGEHPIRRSDPAKKHGDVVPTPSSWSPFVSDNFQTVQPVVDLAASSSAKSAGSVRSSPSSPASKAVAFCSQQSPANRKSAPMAAFFFVSDRQIDSSSNSKGCERK